MNNIDKENVFDAYMNMIHDSWTYNVMTTEEKKDIDKILNEGCLRHDIKGSWKQRWMALNQVYHAYLKGLGYTPNWRDEGDTKEVNNNIWKSFTQFFRQVKGYNTWSDDEIGGSMNNDDINEFIDYIKETLHYENNK